MSRRHNSPARAGATRVYMPPPDYAPAAPEGPPLDENGLPVVPKDWSKGQLLNVRNAGTHYNVTLLGEEYDPRHPERCLQFSNPAECQNFVSTWYQRESGGRPF